MTEPNPHEDPATRRLRELRESLAGKSAMLAKLTAQRDRQNARSHLSQRFTQALAEDTTPEITA